MNAPTNRHAVFTGQFTLPASPGATLRTIKGNLCWASGYNVAAFPHGRHGRHVPVNRPAVRAIQPRRRSATHRWDMVCERLADGRLNE
jgi:hypothetical protein